MSKFENKIDFVVFVGVNNANPNGDPLDGNRPRTDLDGFGEISDVCIKRKVRNRMQDNGERVFVQSEDRCCDGCDSLKSRAEKDIGKAGSQKKPGFLSKEEYAKKACETYLDVRSFGQVFAFEKGGDESKGVSVGVRGPVSIHQAVSCSPIEVESIQITKSVNGNPKDNKASDTMGMKHFVKFGLYKVKGSINVQLAEKTGFSKEDAALLKKCLQTLFVNDASSARPDGSMEVVKLYWWEHNCKEGQYSSATVHKSVDAKVKDGVQSPRSVEDYEFIETALDGLTPEIINGI